MLTRGASRYHRVKAPPSPANALSFGIESYLFPRLSRASLELLYIFIRFIRRSLSTQEEPDSRERAVASIAVI